MTYGDSSDKSGHGTHVSGSVAGLATDSSSGHSQYTGTAPEAKIAFFDLGVDQNGQEGLR